MQMTELTEWAKVFGANVSVVAATSLTDIHLGFKILSVALVCAWTVIRIAKLLKDK
jgi:hypothetical protein